MLAAGCDGVLGIAAKVGAEDWKLVGESFGEDHAGGFHSRGVDEEGALHHYRGDVVSGAHEVDSVCELQGVGDFFEGGGVVLAADDEVAVFGFPGEPGHGLQGEVEAFELVVGGYEKKEWGFFGEIEFGVNGRSFRLGMCRAIKPWREDGVARGLEVVVFLKMGYGGIRKEENMSR